jgi:hypothetical protein
LFGKIRRNADVVALRIVLAEDRQIGVTRDSQGLADQRLVAAVITVCQCVRRRCASVPARNLASAATASGVSSPAGSSAATVIRVPSGKWLEFAGGVISGLFNQPEPALSRRRRSRHDDG